MVALRLDPLYPIKEELTVSLTRSRLPALIAIVLTLSLLAGCAAKQQPRTTARDKTKRGAAVGAGVGALVGALLGEGDADAILKGAAIGAGLGVGVGAYMDRQEEKIARIPGTTVERIGDRRLLVHFNSDVLFATDSAELSSQSRITLQEASKVIAEFNKTAVVVQGHTDSTGSDEHNQELSVRRAQSVYNYFIDRGVDPRRLIARGYGETQPVVSNDTPAGRQLNRRVDLLLKAKEK
jgi:outer membrane protein OmpA-like peptidoglycan-associated protein